MIGLVPEAWKKLLQAKQVVHFVGSYPEYWQQRVAGKYFRIKITQQIPYDRAFIMSPALEHNVDISEDNTRIGDFGLYPDNDATLYEILVGMKSTSGSVLLYPRAPPNEWFLTLEESQFVPVPASNDYRYLGPYNEEITPADRPQLRLHTIKEEEAIGFRLYNDASIDNKIVLVMLVNRCLMDEVRREELTEKELERTRELFHFGLSARGSWGETVP